MVLDFHLLSKRPKHVRYNQSLNELFSLFFGRTMWSEIFEPVLMGVGDIEGGINGRESRYVFSRGQKFILLHFAKQ